MIPYFLVFILTVGSSAWAMHFGPDHPTQPRPGRYTEHLDQRKFDQLVRDHRNPEAFQIAFSQGDLFFDQLFLFDTVFGVGAQVGQGQRFTRVPRADLKERGQWATHFPARATGPNGMSCIECHTQAHHDGGGFVALNVTRDPFHLGDPGKMIQRNTTHLFGAGAIQLLAEEMTDELQRILNEAKQQACSQAAPSSAFVTRPLLAHGISFGKITVKQVYDTRVQKNVCQVITRDVVGVDTDLVVRPFQWKGVVSSIRDFNRGASHNELGLQSVELVGLDVDGDGDGVKNELSVGDLTALTVYVAAQPRPMTQLELAEKGWISPLESSHIASIERGRRVFEQVGCQMCHTPMLTTQNSLFSEPSLNSHFRDLVFPSGDAPISHSLDPQFPIQFDLTTDLNYGTFFEKDSNGKMKVELFSDLKRHDLGREDAESIDEAKTGASTWLTRPLWGCGSTRPYLHDGRATSIAEAVEFHGGEASGSRVLFRALPATARDDLEKFLMNLVLFKHSDTES